MKWSVSDNLQLGDMVATEIVIAENGMWSIPLHLGVLLVIATRGLLRVNVLHGDSMPYISVFLGKTITFHVSFCCATNPSAPSLHPRTSLESLDSQPTSFPHS